ncbi:maleylpyruvate isomerase family mycothiol-dependent enzyme [Streptomyces sp. Z26]|uniref:maleylpyruvate isomerase family mycothiol-dependent enzyme n=1 Tax=Streptomyces sp. Z26 TaxID=2500177 RepID=UPI000EF141E1|nr:maleylpyruvate isomerase family mycothiol-dependent enzyme [Streptomyces sp. Z26]RLL67556.1 maleylpyruvate isomerase family mycothiol-dependent enzyme [Streptomyces sp. Z26]
MASTPPRHARYCTEITEQTRMFRETLAGADLSARVPSCPDWTLRELALHLGRAHRWVHETVRTRARDMVPEDTVPGSAGPAGAGTDTGGAADAGGGAYAEALDRWLAEGAELLVAALRDAGPDTDVWTWADDRSTGFWARRMTHETVVHRTDACLATGRPYEVAPDVAADCVDEWLDIVASPQAQEYDEGLRQLRERAGESLHLHATDQPGGTASGGDLDTGLDTGPAEWLIELGADGPRWRRTHARATTALRGPLTDVLLVFYRRLPLEDSRVELSGDRGLWEFWSARTSFGG